MKELIKLLDEHLDYIDHELTGDTFFIYVASNRYSVDCPFCHTPSSRIHSRYERSFQDLPIQGKKVVIVLENRKFFCENQECGHTTFAERFDVLAGKAKKTKRLEEEILRISLNVSSVAASEILRNQIVDVGKSTICNLIKKNWNND
ncbi:transposase family protein [Enterococcus sp. DIV0187]|uniref:transposase family protein n=1 Tax=Enterococcus sp. DIV0187 TaxID=2774644 RepID=UPI003F261A88